MQDGALLRYQDILADRIVAAALRRDIGRLVTLGAEGFDGSDDHIATHWAAVRAAKILEADHGRQVGILALNHLHQGHEIYAATPELRARTKAAIDAHASQWALAAAGVVPAYTLDRAQNRTARVGVLPMRPGLDGIDLGSMLASPHSRCQGRERSACRHTVQCREQCAHDGPTQCPPPHR